jgi:hypothetical protein
MRSLRQPTLRRSARGASPLVVALALVGFVGIVAATVAQLTGFGLERVAKVELAVGRQIILQQLRARLSCEETLYRGRNANVTLSDPYTVEACSGPIELYAADGQPLFADSKVGDWEIRTTCSAANVSIEARHPKTSWMKLSGTAPVDCYTYGRTALLKLPLRKLQEMVCCNPESIAYTSKCTNFLGAAAPPIGYLNGVVACARYCFSAAAQHHPFADDGNGFPEACIPGADVDTSFAVCRCVR